MNSVLNDDMLQQCYFKMMRMRKFTNFNHFVIIVSTQHQRIKLTSVVIKGRKHENRFFPYMLMINETGMQVLNSDNKVNKKPNHNRD